MERQAEGGIQRLWSACKMEIVQVLWLSEQRGALLKPSCKVSLMVGGLMTLDRIEIVWRTCKGWIACEGVFGRLTDSFDRLWLAEDME